MGNIIVGIEKKGAYYLVALEDGRRVRVPGPLLRQFPQKTGAAFDREAYMEAHLKEAFRFACERAAFLLEKKDYPAQLLRQKLTDCGYMDATADAVLQLVTEKGYVDDRRYARNLIQRRQKKVGPYRIRQELMTRQVDRAAIDDMLEEHEIPQDEQLALATDYAVKYLRTRREKDRLRLRANAVAMLVRKGFSFETAAKAYDLASEGEE